MRPKPRTTAFVSTPTSGETRDCLEPWQLVQITSGGLVKPCCVHSEIGRLEEGCDLHAILSNANARSLRLRLLTGKLDSECRECNNKKVTSIWELRRRFTREVLTCSRDRRHIAIKPVSLHPSALCINEQVTFSLSNGIGGVEFLDVVVDNSTRIEFEVIVRGFEKQVTSVIVRLLESISRLERQTESFRSEGEFTASCDINVAELRGSYTLSVVVETEGLEYGPVVAVDHPWCIS